MLINIFPSYDCIWKMIKWCNSSLHILFCDKSSAIKNKSWTISLTETCCMRPCREHSFCHCASVYTRVLVLCKEQWWNAHCEQIEDIWLFHSTHYMFSICFLTANLLVCVSNKKISLEMPCSVSNLQLFQALKESQQIEKNKSKIKNPGSWH